MTTKGKSPSGAVEGDSVLLKKLLILELFKLGVPQAEIGKKLKMNLATVNAFLRGCKKTQ